MEGVSVEAEECPGEKVAGILGAGPEAAVQGKARAGCRPEAGRAAAQSAAAEGLWWTGGGEAQFGS